MGTLLRRWPTAVGLCCILLLTTACFQSVGDEGGGLQSSVNVTDPPSPTSADTSTPTLIPTDIEAVTEEVGAEAVDLPMAGNPTATATNTATPTSTASATNIPTEVAQLATETADPFELSATSLIASTTARAVLPTTQAAASQGVGIATETPSVTSTFAQPGLGINTPTSQPQTVFPGNDCVYEVRAGDTMWNITRRFGLSVQDVATRNGIANFNLIVVGQRLTIPGCGTSGYRPPATSTPIVTTTPIFGTGGGNNPLATQPGFVNNCAIQYTVQQYDTLFSLSLRYGVPVAAIQNANPEVTNPNLIYMTKTLCIPQ